MSVPISNGGNFFYQCQYKCFRDKQCEHFTYFAKGEIKKCVLFKECETMENCR